MKFTDAVKSCFHQYASFSGRARRSEYWYFTLFNIVLSYVIAFIGGWMDFKGLPVIAYLALFLPGLAVCIRRLHDIGKSGWWYLIGFVPVVGFILLIVWFCRDSEAGPNRYGQNPKGIDYAETPYYQ